MDWSWFNALDQNLQQLLIGVAAEYAGIAGQLAIDAARTRIDARHAPQQQAAAVQAAIERALRDALLQLLPELGDTEEAMKHHLSIFGQWLNRPAVAAEVAKLIAPDPDSDLDLALLRAEFEAADYDPESLTQPFESIVDRLAQGFVNAAAEQPELQAIIGIRTERTIADILTAMAPLNLEELELNYLRATYKDCNELPMADAKPDQLQPRMQRVFVDVRVAGAPATFLTLSERLGLFRFWSSRARRELQRMAASQDQRERMGRSTLPGPDDEDAAWIDAMRRMDEDELRQFAETLDVDADALRRELNNLTPVEVLPNLPRPQLVLLGDPGSGKSTVTRRIAGILAGLRLPDKTAEWTEDERLYADTLLRAFGRWLLPVRVVLNRWAQHADGCEGCAADLVDECWRLWQTVARPEGPQAKDRFIQKFTGDSPNIIVLLDGLDEVTDEQQRATLLRAVRHFLDTYPQVPVIVTCRVRPYDALRNRGEALPLPSVTLDRLADFDIHHFVERWHAELTAAGLWDTAVAEPKRQKFEAELYSRQRPELAEMAGTPLLLTMMLNVNYDDELPESRAELYEKFVEQLLFEWERTKQEDRTQQPALVRLLNEAGASRNRLEYHLNRLAFTLHGGAALDTVDIPAGVLRRTLMAVYLGDLDDDEDPEELDDAERAGKAKAWAINVMKLIGDRSGLINLVDPETHVYKFSHRTFQEYLAARWIALGVQPKRKFDAHIDDGDWREAVLLAFGYQCRVGKPPYDTTVGLIHELWPEHLGGTGDVRRALLLGEALAWVLGPARLKDVEYRKPARDLQRTVAEHLTQIMQQPALTAYLGDAKAQARTRLAAGLLLADLEELPPGLDDLVEVPGAAFRIGRYPVTNHQFRRFVDAGGYGIPDDARPPWWSEEGWERRVRNEWVEPRYWDDKEFNRSTQPVVGVSWYEAAAYCNWLTERWRAEAVITAGEVVRLPTQGEWEAAARGGHPAPADDAVDYPWRGPFEPWRANTEESDLGQTTPVHMYPDGRTPGSVWDMSGNVWEWTSDRYKASFEAYYRKGGAYYSEAAMARASAADRDFANYRFDHLGFRVVVVPISRSP